MNEELRCYTFTDFMLSSIQQGIQSGHASMELVSKYLLVTGWQNGYAEQVSDWVQNHKTIICLNGGAFADVTGWLQFFEDGLVLSHQNDFPFVGFTEEESQGGNLTSVAAILPERIFNGVQALREAKWNDEYVVVYDHLLEETRITFDNKTAPLTLTYNKWERELMERLKRARFAQ
ncbi:MAG: hypothetical protein ACTSPB_18340 [Candidatus Thorarchaeota archaeon]